MKFNVNLQIIDPDSWKTQSTVEITQSRPLYLDNNNQALNLKHSSINGLRFELKIEEDHIVLINGQNKQSISAGDKINFGDFKIEFQEIQKIQETEAETQFVDVSMLSQKSADFSRATMSASIKKNTQTEIIQPKQKTNIYLENNKVFSVKTPPAENASKLNKNFLKLGSITAASLLVLSGGILQYSKYSKLIQEQQKTIAELQSKTTTIDDSIANQNNEYKNQIAMLTEENQKNKKIIEEQRLNIKELENEINVPVQEKLVISQKPKKNKIKIAKVQKKSQKSILTKNKKETGNKDFSEDFILASKAGQISKVNNYIKMNKAIINSKDKNGNTALIWAAAKNNKALAAMLLSHHANIYLKNNKGLSALDFAKHNNFSELVDLLQSKKVRNIASPKKK